MTQQEKINKLMGQVKKLKVEKADLLERWENRLHNCRSSYIQGMQFVIRHLGPLGSAITKDDITEAIKAAGPTPGGE